MNIRPERLSDHSTVYAINAEAFETDAEAGLVDALRMQASPIVSLVAEIGDHDESLIVGHILFSPVALSGHTDFAIMGLAPMAVLPEYQHKGIGSALIYAGIEACKKLDIQALIVLGHPEYYPKFGFISSTRFGIASQYSVPDDVFMAMELEPNSLEGRSGVVSYHSAFDAL
jgi:putative acetyltransferase